MSRYDPNWIAFGCGIAYILAFLFLPVYTLLANITGLTVLLLNFAAIVPLLLGVAMALCALLINPKISIGVACAVLVGTLIFSLLGNSVLMSTPLVAMVSEAVGSSVFQTVASYIPVRMGWGSIVCMLLCLAHIAAEILVGTQRVKPRHETVSFDGFDNGPGSIDF